MVNGAAISLYTNEGEAPGQPAMETRAMSIP